MPLRLTVGNKFFLKMHLNQSVYKQENSVVLLHLFFYYEVHYMLDILYDDDMFVSH